jgi:hypothetical protein
LGLALTAHRDSIIFRREYPQLKAIVERSRALVGTRGRYNAQDKLWRLEGGRTLEFGAVEHEWSAEKFQGRPHDLVGFDELPHFSRGQFRFLTGWCRTTVPGQRCRVVATGNPPTTPEGRWVVEEWAPWLDPQHPDPAEPGELRWYAVLEGKLTWLRDGTPFAHQGELITPTSRTFIPGRVDDNPHLLRTNYKTRLQSLPEPLRSQVLYGDFTAGLGDDPWQVIPTEWVRAAQARWRPEGGRAAPVSALGVDVARGGSDKTVIARRHKDWFAPLEKHAGAATPDGPAVVALVQKILAEQRGPSVPALVVDVIGVGSSVYDGLRQRRLPNVVGFNAAAGTDRRDRTGTLGFANLRACALWLLRESLDPGSGRYLALPPDPELLADLTAPRWSVGPGGVKVESKEDVVRRLGRSPDCGDAVVLAHYQAVPTMPAPPVMVSGGVQTVLGGVNPAVPRPVSPGFGAGRVIASGGCPIVRP